MGETFKQGRAEWSVVDSRRQPRAVRQRSKVSLVLAASAFLLPAQGWARAPIAPEDAPYVGADSVVTPTQTPLRGGAVFHTPLSGLSGLSELSGTTRLMHGGANTATHGAAGTLRVTVQSRPLARLRGQVPGQQGVSLRQLSVQDLYRLNNSDQRAVAGAARADDGERKRNKPREDPLEGMNRTFYKINDFLDRTFFRPLAMVYKAVFPKFMRTGIRHFFRNLNEPVTFINDVLQAKPRRALRTLARFTANTVYGVAGLFDVGKSFNLPYKRNGFGNTLGRWGMDPGPYLFLPLLGPTTFRDAGGQFVDSRTLPWAIGKPFNRKYYTIPRTVLTGLDRRVEVDEDLKTLMRDAADPYATIRSVYLQSRKAEIDRLRNKNSAIDPALEQDLIDPEANPAQAAAYGAYASGGVDSDLPPAPDIPADATSAAPVDPAVQPGDPAISVAPLSDENAVEQDIAADSPADGAEAP